MARPAKIEVDTPTKRNKLAVRDSAYLYQIEPGLALGYRRFEKGAGKWIVKRRTGPDRYVVENLRAKDHKTLTIADDVVAADGFAVLSFPQALALARESVSAAALAKHGKILTVRQAVEKYGDDLADRNKDQSNVQRINAHLKDLALADTAVVALKVKDFDEWKDGMRKKKLEPATRNRINSNLKAALNLAVRNDPEITNRAWETALPPIEGANEINNVILSNKDVGTVVSGAYEYEDDCFGLFVEVTAETGARPVQTRGLQVWHLLADPPRLLMPRSKKGRGEKKIKTQQVPITDELYARLLKETEGRGKKAPLLRKADGTAWGKSEHSRRFDNVIANVKLDYKPVEGENVTLYALRHSAIVRELMMATPLSIVAQTHDTSEAEIRRTYAAHLTDHTDAITRKALVSFRSTLPTENVVSITDRRTAVS